eukprot:122573-Chlamydomonas_euryale.AAC.2
MPFLQPAACTAVRSVGRMQGLARKLACCGQPDNTNTHEPHSRPLPYANCYMTQLPESIVPRLELEVPQQLHLSMCQLSSPTWWKWYLLLDVGRAGLGDRDSHKPTRSYSPRQTGWRAGRQVGGQASIIHPSIHPSINLD